MKHKVSIIIEKDENGFYAFSPELKGCQTQGDTFEEAYTNIKEAIDLYLETLEPEELTDLLSHDIFTSSYEVALV
jgi:predicted RNase H-like HicB family nuclease